MRTIYKYHLEILDLQVLSLPDDARILHVADQRGQLCVWCDVSDDAPLVECEFRIVGTGHPFPDGDNWWHVGTVSMDRLVWHIFAGHGWSS